MTNHTVRAERSTFSHLLTATLIATSLVVETDGKSNLCRRLQQMHPNPLGIARGRRMNSTVTDRTIEKTSPGSLLRWRPSRPREWVFAAGKTVFLGLFWFVPFIGLLVSALGAFIQGFVSILDELIWQTPVWLNRVLGIGSFTYFLVFVSPFLASGPDDMVANVWNAPDVRSTLRAYFVEPFQRRTQNTVGGAKG